MNQPRGSAASRLGKRIRAARKDHGWSQYTLAEIMQVSQGTVSKWESGSLIPSSVDLSALFEHLTTLDADACLELIREHRHNRRPAA